MAGCTHLHSVAPPDRRRIQPPSLSLLAVPLLSRHRRRPSRAAREPGCGDRPHQPGSPRYGALPDSGPSASAGKFQIAGHRAMPGDSCRIRRRIPVHLEMRPDLLPLRQQIGGVPAMVSDLEHRRPPALVWLGGRDTWRRDDGACKRSRCCCAAGDSLRQHPLFARCCSREARKRSRPPLRRPAPLRSLRQRRRHRPGPPLLDLPVRRLHRLFEPREASTLFAVHLHGPALAPVALIEHQHIATLAPRPPSGALLLLRHGPQPTGGDGDCTASMIELRGGLPSSMSSTTPVDARFLDDQLDRRQSDLLSQGPSTGPLTADHAASASMSARRLLGPQPPGSRSPPAMSAGASASRASSSSSSALVL